MSKHEDYNTPGVACQVETSDVGSSAPELTTRARDLHAQARVVIGWDGMPLCLAPLAKSPGRKSFKDSLVETVGQIPKLLRNRNNLGVALGPNYGDATHIDPDCAPSRAACAFVLSSLSLPSWTRASRAPLPTGYLCRSPGCHSFRFVLPKVLAELPQWKDDGHGRMVVELKCDKNGEEKRSEGEELEEGEGALIACIPPSQHESGEFVRWLNEPGEEGLPIVDAEELRRKCGLAAFLAVALAFYPEPGSQERNEYILRVTGSLAWANYSQEEIEELIGWLAEQAGDEEAKDRIKNAKYAVSRVEKAKPTKGVPKLVEMLVKDEADRKDCADELTKWLRGTNSGSLTRAGPFKHVHPKSGKPQATLTNTRIAFGLLGIGCRYDLFKNRVVFDREGLPTTPGDNRLEDQTIYALMELIEAKFDFSPSKTMVMDAARMEANHHMFHPIRDYLDGLKWDEVPRLDTWLSVYAGAEDNEYTRAIGRITMIAGVRRVREPGTKYDYLLVLESAVQGKGKSTLVEMMARNSEYYTDDVSINITSREFMEKTEGRWIVEFSELAGLRKTDVERFKSLVSRKVDTSRRAYDMLPTDQYRQFIPIGTTNALQYLSDLSGNRRVLPVTVGEIRLEAFEQNIDQLWAEAAHYEAQGESIVVPKHLWEAAAEEQDARLIDNPFVETFGQALGNMEGKVANDALYEALLAHTHREKTIYSRQVTEAMTKLGWRRPNKKCELRFADGTKRCWVKGPGPDFVTIKFDPRIEPIDPVIARLVPPHIEKQEAEEEKRNRDEMVARIEGRAIGRTKH